MRVGVVGLGVGSLAAYSEPGQEFTFFEINPAVERIATDTEFFTLLDDADDRHVKIRIVLGDGRRSLESTGSPDFNLLVIDAFSGDAVPVHLLTSRPCGLISAGSFPTDWWHSIFRINIWI